MGLVLGCAPSGANGGSAGGGSSETADGDASSGESTGVDPTSPDGSSGSSGDESTGTVEPTLCLVRTPVDELSADVLVPADVDGDHAIELWQLVEDTGSIQLTAFAFDVDRTLTVHDPITRPGAPLGLADVDGDGRDDLLVQGATDAQWYAGTAATTFAEQPNPLVLPSDGTITFADGDGDGAVDVFGTVGGAIGMWHGDGTGAFALTGTVPLDVEQHLITVYPTPMPGVLVASYSTGSIGFGGPMESPRVIGVDAAGGLDELPTPPSWFWTWVGAADFDDDGALDLVMQQHEDGPNELRVWRGGGDGFAEVVIGQNPSAAHVGAFRGEGPVLLAQFDGPRIYAAEHDGEAGEPIAGEFPPLSGAQVLDLEGDGRDELLEGNHAELITTWAIVEVLPCE